MWIPTVKHGKHVARGELILVDRDLAELVAWNDIPTLFIRRKNSKRLEEVEPWRAEKIEKVA